jgi:hypothetical protein
MVPVKVCGTIHGNSLGRPIGSGGKWLVRESLLTPPFAEVAFCEPLEFEACGMGILLRVGTR